MATFTLMIAFLEANGKTCTLKISKSFQKLFAFSIQFTLMVNKKQLDF